MADAASTPPITRTTAPVISQVVLLAVATKYAAPSRPSVRTTYPARNRPIRGSSATPAESTRVSAMVSSTPTGRLVSIFILDCSKSFTRRESGSQIRRFPLYPLVRTLSAARMPNFAPNWCHRTVLIRTVQHSTVVQLGSHRGYRARDPTCEPEWEGPSARAGGSSLMMRPCRLSRRCGFRRHQ